jgi:hypothetical protein
MYPNEPWFLDFNAKQVGQDFMPALGFVNRTGVREYLNKISRRTRLTDASIRWYDFGIINDGATDLHNRILNRRHTLQAQIQNNSGDTFTAGFNHRYEYLDRIFALPGGLSVPIGHYSWNNPSARIETSSARPLFANWTFECCSFYDGQYLSNDLQLNYRPSGTYDIMLRHVLNRIEIDQQVDIT